LRKALQSEYRQIDFAAVGMKLTPGFAGRIRLLIRMTACRDGWHHVTEKSREEDLYPM
jgi:hypothetical protein